MQTRSALVMMALCARLSSPAQNVADRLHPAECNASRSADFGAFCRISAGFVPRLADESERADADAARGLTPSQRIGAFGPQCADGFAIGPRLGSVGVGEAARDRCARSDSVDAWWLLCDYCVITWCHHVM